VRPPLARRFDPVLIVVQMVPWMGLLLKFGGVF
jgi:hypothetical protein